MAKLFPYSPEWNCMTSRATDPDRIVMTIAAPNGDRLDLMVCADWSCGIARNGQLIPGERWGLSDMPACVDALLRLGGLVIADRGDGQHRQEP